jgi:serine/threonine-protein kinase
MAEPPVPNSALGNPTPSLSPPADPRHTTLPVGPDAGPEASPSGKAGRNLLFDEIARGGMGAVLRGRDPDLRRELAVKVLLEAHLHPQMVRRFLEEAQITGQLQHPGVVPVYELGRFDDDRPFFTMKLVKGHTLAALLGRRPTPQDEQPRFLKIFEQVCQTVAYAHARGVIHRDLKPANVMVGGFGEVLVMDWGLAKVLAGNGATAGPAPAPGGGATVIHTGRSGQAADWSRTGSVLGTPAFMPPEQANGETDGLDARADVFGLGAILCAILTGEPPYRGQAGEVQRKAMRGDLADARARLDGCGADAALVELAKDCLSPETADRPRDAGEVAKHMATYHSGVQERLRRAELDRAAAQVKAAEERKRRRLTVALAAALLALVTGAGLGGLYYQRQRADEARQVAERQAEQARQAAELRVGVEAGLDRAADLRQRARWPEARAVLEQLDSRLGPNGPADLRTRVGQARADVALVDRLEAIRLKRATVSEGKFDDRSAQQDYPLAFREAGLGGPEEDAAAVAARIGQSAIRTQLVAALDDWAVADPEPREWLLKVARLADPDPWGARFRDPQLWQNRSTLEALADELLGDRVKLANMQPATLVLVAEFLQSAKENAVPLLAEVQALHPNDFWLNFALGNALSEAKRADEAVGYYRAALGVRPDSAAAHHNLGNALHDKKELDAAILEYRVAIALDLNRP